MTAQPDAWTLRESTLDVDDPRVVASLLAVANGYVGVRGVLDETDPDDDPATLVASVYEEFDQTYAERAYGYPEVEERLVPVVDAWRLGWSVDGEPVDVRAAAEDDAVRVAGTVEAHERSLDLRHGALHRTLRWASPSGGRVTLRAERLVPLSRREVVATRWHVEAHDDVTVAVRPVTGCTHGEAEQGRTAPGLVTVSCRHEAEGSSVRQRTVRSERGVAVETAHRVEAADDVAAAWHRRGGGAVLVAELRAGQRLTLEVLAAYAGGPDADALPAHARAVLAGAVDAGWDALAREQTDAMEHVWERGDVELDGDDEMQLAVRHALLAVVQAAARVEGVGVRAKGLTGTGYGGHAFWDSESFVLPVLDQVLPGAAAAHLRWRHATLPHARERAAELGLPGAAFPWRTISGRESSGYWPASTAAVHVAAAVALGAVRHVAATHDDDLARDVAVDLAVETARLWAARGHHTAAGFRIDGVTGPDEYTAVVDNNTYTNLMARKNLRAADELCARFPDAAARLGVDEDERAGWLRAADRMVVPYDAELGVTEQSQDFTRHAHWDFAPRGTARFPLDDHVHYVELYRRQVVKQADLVLALHTAPEEFTPEQRRRDFDYYEPLTVRDSSLSAPAQAVVAAEIGYVDLAYDYARECALLDLRDLRGSADGGLHVASLAGAWTALVTGVAGLRHDDGALRLAPRLPARLTRLAFAVHHGDARARVEVRRDGVTYRLESGDALRVVHGDETVDLTPADPEQVRPLLRGVAGPPPAQPPGRAPLFEASPGGGS
ncbi:glycoside hydrolase family 65 protein [Cellulosimicrobium composti]|uniref:Glycoside hydrolase family 65 protein n=1 Tax=Cellulosimicrobium composti TaxID=2672572 RepID=A0ABX0BC29_9MICO|nr:glycosyl hydrolase family 65 protein [Cellulosimicrobium composti]NDO89716.1 glycoside hydrolase family 65 protein [Cellulosimicrobium composti]